MTHSKKVKIAKRLKKEEKGWSGRAGMFQTDAWLERKENIAARVARKQGATKKRAVARKSALTK